MTMTIDGTNGTTYPDASVQARAGKVLAQVSFDTQTGVLTGTTTVPLDDTIPQNTEGTQFLSATITPISATSVLEIDVVLNFSHSVSTAVLIAAVFQDSTANALVSGVSQNVNNGGINQVVIKYRMTSGTTSATTFKVRAGSPTAGTLTINGVSSARQLGGVLQSSITIKEYLP